MIGCAILTPRDVQTPVDSQHVGRQQAIGASAGAARSAIV